MRDLRADDVGRNPEMASNDCLPLGTSDEAPAAVALRLEKDLEVKHVVRAEPLTMLLCINGIPPIMTGCHGSADRVCEKSERHWKGGRGAGQRVRGRAWRPTIPRNQGRPRMPPRGAWEGWEKESRRWERSGGGRS